MKFVKIAAYAAAATLTMSFSASASTTTSYQATNAVGSGANHAVWFSGGLGAYGKSFTFIEDSGLFVTDTQTAQLTGKAESNAQAGSGFMVSASYDSDFSDFPGNAPSFKSENGSAVASDTYFLNMTGATFTGYGDLAGLDFAAVRKPEPTTSGVYYATQIGSAENGAKSANNKNFEYGLANWFTFSATSTSCSVCSSISAVDGNGRQGDFNLNLVELIDDNNPDLSPVPVPASLPLLLAGMGGLAALRRRTARA